tara:strand:- start:163 stop:510 length:348 start_codon:yes stop_codon:yes gene_type:complete
MNNTFKIALVGIAIYSAYRIGKIEKDKKQFILSETKKVKKGSFSKEIELLQKNINGIYGFEKLPISGAFCKKTKNELDVIFKDSKFYDNSNGSIQIETLKEINKIFNSLNNQIQK